MAPMTVDLRVPNPGGSAVRCDVLAGMAGYPFTYRNGVYQSVIIQSDSPKRVAHVGCDDRTLLPAFGDKVYLAQTPDGNVIAMSTASQSFATTVWKWHFVSTTHLSESKATVNRAKYRAVPWIRTIVDLSVGLPGFAVYGAWLLADKLRAKRLAPAIDRT
ncbi:MAG: hypothetical protein WBB94_01600, partial [Candidatus Saccharimonadaceae bacterium]